MAGGCDLGDVTLQRELESDLTSQVPRDVTGSVTLCKDNAPS